MSWSLNNTQGDAAEVDAEIAVNAGHDREQKVLDAVKTAVKNIVDEIGGYVSISGSGHVNEEADQPGDSVSLSIASLPRPGGPTPDSVVAASEAASAPAEAVTLSQQVNPTDIHNPADLTSPAAPGNPDPGVVTETVPAGISSAPPAVVGEPSAPQSPVQDVVAAQTGGQSPVAPEVGSVASVPAGEGTAPAAEVNAGTDPNAPAPVAGETAVPPVEAQPASVSPAEGSAAEEAQESAAQESTEDPSHEGSW